MNVKMQCYGVTLASLREPRSYVEAIAMFLLALHFPSSE